MTNAFQVIPSISIFVLYDIENTVINGKAHYTSDDRTTAIWYGGECGVWIIGPSDLR